jgi:hypothetical protein
MDILQYNLFAKPARLHYAIIVIIIPMDAIHVSLEPFHKIINVFQIVQLMKDFILTEIIVILVVRIA